MKQEERIDPDGAKTVYTYDDADRHVRTTDYDAAGRISCDIHYAHDVSGQVTGWRVQGQGEGLFLRFEVARDAAGREVELRQYDARNALMLRTVTVYDDAGAAQATQYDGQGRLIDA